MIDGSQLQIPTSIVTMQDIGRLQRELSAINDFFNASTNRRAGQQASLPKTTADLENLARKYGCNLLLQDDRTRLGQELAGIRAQAVAIDISFAAIPSKLFLQKILAWFRANIDQNIVINVGHQPSIASGCIVRTSSHTYDLSFGNKLAKAKPTLIELFRN